MPDDNDPYTSKGMALFLDAFFRQTAKAQALARLRGDQRAVEAITDFYLSARCQNFVELSGYSYERFLERKGLKAAAYDQA